MPETVSHTTARKNRLPNAENISLQMKQSQNSRMDGFASLPTISGKRLASRTARTSIIGFQPRHN